MFASDTTPASRFSIDELCWWHTLYTIVTHLLEQENLCFKTLLKTLLSLACGQTSVVFSNRPLVKLDLWVENGTNEISEKWNKHFEVACISFRQVHLASYGRSLDVLSGQYRTQNYLEGMLKKTPIYLTNRFFFCSQVVIVGNGAVGKSSMIQRYCRGTFTRDYKKTIGVDFLERIIEWVPNATHP